MLGIIGAMDQEVNILKEKMEVKKIDKRASMEFYVGILNGKEVVIVKCGVGKVNAAGQKVVQKDAGAVVHRGHHRRRHRQLHRPDLLRPRDRYDLHPVVLHVQRGGPVHHVRRAHPRRLYSGQGQGAAG